MSTLKTILLLTFFSVASPLIANASDPDIITDFIIPQNLTLPMILESGNLFTFSGLRILFDDNTPEPDSFTVYKASASEFPALLSQSVSFAVLFFPLETVNPPHIHPRSAELLLLINGMLDVGFVDTQNNLYTQTLQPGDMFVFPKGLVHFQTCRGKEPAIAVSGFGSANAGTVSIPKSAFGSGIDDEVIAKSLKTDVSIVQKIKAGF
ncbi:LOW QUALITY PROTEIN: putative germin-like protein 9-2 [Asparagus officinalis]|uniref:LOW QUALITY PROTEIN: putative germin-like protein 9-2 n=1 Tax=Asparagus officinalis TaxID=4686 RepID=UPI00098DEC60|nr:LOW QUALITY PROTEIN: putative germin-like protein 9-2 [Asparagus officinalis]